MRPFTLRTPGQPRRGGRACSTSTAPAARVLAGGTDLIIRLRDGTVRPEVVVDVKRIRGADAGIRPSATAACVIGARTVMTDIAADAGVRRDFPALAEAASVVGSVQIRNRATLAGNICNASPAADTAPPCSSTARWSSCDRLGRDPRGSPSTTSSSAPGVTALAAGELVTAIELPLPRRPAGSASTSGGRGGAVTTSPRSRWPVR